MKPFSNDRSQHSILQESTIAKDALHLNFPAKPVVSGETKVGGNLDSTFDGFKGYGSQGVCIDFMWDFCLCVGQEFIKKCLEYRKERRPDVLSL